MGDYGAAVSQKGYDVKTCADRFLLYSSAFQTLKIFNTYSVSTTIPVLSGGEFTANASTDYITFSVDYGDSLVNDTPITVYSFDTLPGGLSEDTIYYVVNKSGSTCQLSLTKGGSPVNITSAGSGTHYYDSSHNTITINHNIDFIVPFVVIYNGSTSIGTSKSYFMCDSQGQSMGNAMDFTSGTSYGNAKNYSNKFDIEIDGGFDIANSNSGDTVYFTVYLFLDDFSTINENTISSGVSKLDESVDYGFRISKSGFDVKNCDDKDCVLSSSFFNNIIHKKGTFTGEGSVSFNLSYIPTVLCFTKMEGESYILFSDLADLTSNTLSIYSNENDTNYYIIFK